MWLTRYAALCQECPDVVAVYESPSGRLGLLLRQTPIPLPQEYVGWRADTRRVARGLIEKLRGAGFRGGFAVLQWLPPRQTADIIRTWPCRYVGDAWRRIQLTAVAERHVADERFLAAQAPWRLPPPFAASPDGVRALRRWYDAQLTSWLGIEPVLRRALILRSHRWIAGRVLVPAADGRAPALEDLKTGASLERSLQQLVPPDDLAYWRPWIQLALAELERALRRPATEWDFSWVRALFWLPVRIPAPVPHDVA